MLCSQKIMVRVILQKQLGSDGKVCDSAEAASGSQGCVLQGCKEQQAKAKGLVHLSELLTAFALSRKAADG